MKTWKQIASTVYVSQLFESFMGSNVFAPSLLSLSQLKLPKIICNSDDWENGMINNVED